MLDATHLSSFCSSATLSAASAEMAFSAGMRSAMFWVSVLWSAFT